MARTIAQERRIALKIQKQLRQRFGLPEPTLVEQQIFAEDIAGIRPAARKKKKRGKRKK